MNPVSYLAVDLETTGLDPVQDQILEIAWMPLDFHFVPLAPVQSRVIRLTDAGGARLMLNDYVRKMHAENGLTGDAAVSALSVEGAERAVLDSLHGLDFSLGQPVIFGSSVHFDLRFIEAQMPTLRKALHYRVLDVSTLLAFAAAADIQRVDRGDVAHRAAADISWSVQTARDLLASARGMAARSA